MGSGGDARGSRLVVAGGALGLLAMLAADATSVGARETPVIGEAERVVSEVRGIFGEITRELVVEDEVHSQEVIETGLEAATRIVFLDGTELSMGPMSRITLDRYVYDPATGTGELVANFISGIFEFASGLIPASGYDLRTPFANLAIRGTLIQLRVGATMELAVPEGRVTVHDALQTREIAEPSACLVWSAPGAAAELTSLDGCAALAADIALARGLLDTGAPEPGRR